MDQKKQPPPKGTQAGSSLMMFAPGKYHSFVLLPLVALFLAFPTGHSTADEDLQQDPIVIKGSQSLPKALYIAPWKRVGSPLVMQEPEVDIGEAHEPIEQDLFEHELELRSNGYGTEAPTTESATGRDTSSVTNRP